MHYEQFTKNFWTVLVLMLLILPVQTNAQDMSGVIDKLQEILNKLADIKTQDTELIRNSETNQRQKNGQQEGLIEIDRTKSSFREDSLISDAQGNLDNTNTNIQAQRDRINQLHTHMNTGNNVDGVLKALQMQLQFQSINASSNTTNNFIQRDKFQAELTAKKIQDNLKTVNRNMYIPVQSQTSTTNVNFGNQFRIGSSRNQ